MSAKYVVGIDLGTTHSAVAFSPVGEARIGIFRVPQLVAPGETAPFDLLPSVVYLPAAGELPEGATRLPWGEAPSWIVGEWARRLGARVPGRLVASAKSWLSHAGVDRTAAILPWGAPPDVEKIAPVTASARLLAHVRAAWDAAHPDAPLARQEVVLTVPASFDEVARELTVQAAREAGIDRLRLLEEPQAAFYDFLHQHEGALEAAVGEARLALVIDVGGGTTDLTLVRIERQPSGPPRIERIAVGEHLMLGGDNMDVTLARHVEQQLGERLDAARWSALVHASRLAKEALLAAEAPPEYGVAVLGRGTKMIGGGRTVRLRREEAESILLDGFFPRTSIGETTQRRGRAGLTELGLPYASDPAITRHVNAFLRRHVQAAAETGVTVHDGLPRPDALLLNGGVFNAPAITARLAEVLAGWFGDPVPLFAHGSLDLAVARGAAYYGLVRRGFGVKIGGGSPRAYYVGVEGSGGARRALCVVPRGMEEGSEVEVPGRTFDLVVGRPVTFPLFAATGARHDAPGEVVDVDEELDPLPPLHTVIRADANAPAPRPGQPVTLPVRIAAALTEIGTLELSLRGESDRRWRLEFSLRGEAGEEKGGGAAVAPIDQLPRRFDEARALVELCYGKKAQPVEAKEIKNLWRNLERIIGPRDGWSSAVNRELWGVVLGGAQKRRRTADHERTWFQLAGFCLRPGFGAPLDAWRISELWKVWPQQVQYTTEKQNWAEWWILWRRVAGGLDAGQQKQILDFVRPWLKPPEGRFPPKPKGPRAEGFDEMLRLAASLERISAQEKVEVGRWVIHRLEGTKKSWWPLGRLGARQPFAGSAHDVVPPDVAEAWLRQLLALDWKRTEGAAFAAAQIARRTGDRGRDVSDEMRAAVAERLEAMNAPESWVRMVREGGELSLADEMRVFGDTLPTGLRLA